MLPLVLFAIAAWRYRWLSDDGFINLRVVRQLQAGNGPVFNAGERVEASTSPLWVAVLALADLFLPIRLEWLAVVGGIAGTIAGLALLLAGATRLSPRRATRGLVIPTGIWILVARSRPAGSSLPEGSRTASSPCGSAPHSSRWPDGPDDRAFFLRR